jgi:YVTN family beta-propeller protein
VTVVDTAGRRAVATLAVGAGPHAVAVAPDGVFAYVANTGTNTISVVDLATTAVVKTVQVEQGPSAIAVAPVPGAGLPSGASANQAAGPGAPGSAAASGRPIIPGVTSLPAPRELPNTGAQAAAASAGFASPVVGLLVGVIGAIAAGLAVLSTRKVPHAPTRRS